MKLGVIYKADPYLSLRSSPQANASAVTRLNFTHVFIHKELPGDWYFVVTENGQARYMPKWTVKVDQPGHKRNSCSSRILVNYKILQRKI